MRTGPSAADVAGMLFARRAEWLPRYFPAGRIRGSVFELGSADGDPGDSLPVPIGRQQRVTDFAGGFNGDDLALLARAIGAGDDMAAAYREALTYLGLAQGSTTPARPPPPRPPAPPSSSRSEKATDLWREAHPVCACEACAPARQYLIGPRTIPSWPETLHFHPHCPYRLDHGPLRFTPAILAPVNDHRSGYVVAVWRILLTPGGEKIDRLGLGPCAGNCARLYPPDGDELAITEGVEDAVAFHLISGLPAWAALSASLMCGTILPKHLRRITIVQDNDPPNEKGQRPGQDAAQALARRLRTEGRSVEIVAAVDAKDPNDVLARRAAL